MNQKGKEKIPKIKARVAGYDAKSQVALLLDLAAPMLLRLLITDGCAKNVYKISHYQSPHLARTWHSPASVVRSLITRAR